MNVMFRQGPAPMPAAQPALNPAQSAPLSAAAAQPPALPAFGHDEVRFGKGITLTKRAKAGLKISAAILALLGLPALGAAVQANVHLPWEADPAQIQVYDQSGKPADVRMDGDKLVIDGRSYLPNCKAEDGKTVVTLEGSDEHTYYEVRRNAKNPTAVELVNPATGKTVLTFVGVLTNITNAQFAYAGCEQPNPSK